MSQKPQKECNWQDFKNKSNVYQIFNKNGDCLYYDKDNKKFSYKSEDKIDDLAKTTMFKFDLYKNGYVLQLAGEDAWTLTVEKNTKKKK